MERRGGGRRGGWLTELSIAREPKSHHWEGLSCSISQALPWQSHPEGLNY